jgi:class 3 adenylate cyclase
MKRIVKYFIPTGLPDDEEVQRKANLTVGTLLIITIFNLNYSAFSWFIDYPGGLISQVSLFLVGLITLFLYRSGIRHFILMLVYFIFCSVSIAITVFYTGGFSSELFAWLATTPIVALLIWNKRGSLLSLLVVVAIEIGFFYFAQQDYVFPQQIKPGLAEGFYLACNLGLVLILYWIAFVFENAKDMALQNLSNKNVELAKEKKKSDDLLLNILPASVAEELKETGGSKAGLFENVSVLFLDIVDFTLIGEDLSPQELVNELNHCFTLFDNLVTKNQMEKIKTVGDSYIAVSGLPAERANHAEIAVDTALDMMEVIEKYGEDRRKANKPYFQFRAGIHSGPLVAGIVGIKKFAYDIWGDTVNIAARMEQNGEGGKVNISNQTYELVKHKFQTEVRGKLPAKNKGDIEMYFVRRDRN